MANLANIVKNINPPIDLTQSEYNNLSTEQKNGGNIFYIEDGTQINQNASELETDSSNVQTQLNTFNNIIDEILTGQQHVYSTSYISAFNEGGYQTDQYGNFIHKSSTTTNCFTIMPYEGNPQTGSEYYPLRVYYQTGEIRCKHQKDLVIGKGQSVTFSNVRCCGAMSGYKGFYFQIPFITAASSATVTAISNFYLPNNAGSYLYMKYGSNAASSIMLNGKQIWKNSAQVYASSISSITTALKPQSVIVGVVFTNAPVTTSTGTTQLNYIPIFMLANITIQFS